MHYLPEKAEVLRSPDVVEGEWRHLWAVRRATPCVVCGRTIAPGERCTRGNGPGAMGAAVCADCRPWWRWRRWTGKPRVMTEGDGPAAARSASDPLAEPAWMVIA
jgi:hypothetical protein